MLEASLNARTPKSGMLSSSHLWVLQSKTTCSGPVWTTLLPKLYAWAPGASNRPASTTSRMHRPDECEDGGNISPTAHERETGTRARARRNGSACACHLQFLRCED